MTGISRRQFLKWSLLTGATLLLPTPALAANAFPGDGGAAPIDVAFIDHYNLRGYSEGTAATRKQIAQLKHNLDQAAALGVSRYVLFMGDTFEGLLTYDFDMDGVGRVGQVFREGGSDRTRAAFLRDVVRQAVDHATARGVRLYVNTNQFDISKPVYRLLSGRLAGSAGSPVCPGREDTWRLYRGKLGEFFGLFPEIAGLQVTADESMYSILDCQCDYCRDLSPLDRVNRLARETAATVGAREVQVRAWQFLPALEAYDPARMFDGLPDNVLVSLKSVNSDFLLNGKFDDRLIGAGDPARQIVEFDAWREYDGHNYFPTYLGDTLAAHARAAADRGVRRFGVRLNWNKGNNPIFELPWGNFVNIYALQALARNPNADPDRILRRFVAQRFPAEARAAAFSVYKLSPQLKFAAYFLDDDYLAHHTRLPKDLERTSEIYATVKDRLQTADDFGRRRAALDDVYATLTRSLDALDGSAPPDWVAGLRRGARMDWFVGMGLLNQMQAISPARDEAGLAERILDNDRRWEAEDNASYLDMRGPMPKIILGVG
ncbi:MAG: twin-arginine translocation signal domain-containing protein [Anaerolineae bacterium]